jgi:3-dehydroquinate synthase
MAYITMIPIPEPFDPFPIFSSTASVPLTDEGMRVVSVNIDHHPYKIYIGDGILEKLGEKCLSLFPAQKRYVIITDDQVAVHALPLCEKGFHKAGLETVSYILPSGEKTKSFSVLESLLDFLLEQKVDRSHRIIALGGGVIGDLVGFAASLLRRGTGFIQVPTTLLSQVDSSVGGKTAVNSKFGKNLIGAFHQPDLVWADIALLKSLPHRELLAGYAEVVKYALLGDSVFFDVLEENALLFLSGNDTLAQMNVIAHACSMKANIVERDEKERAERALLNLGHTFGHALEAELQYDGRLLHGEAVAIGMVLAFDFSVALGICSQDDAVRVRKHFELMGLPTSIQAIGLKTTSEKLIAHMMQDKKIIEGKLTLILTTGIGKAFITRDIIASELTKFLEPFL